MKRYLSILLGLLMVFTLVSCSTSNSKTQPTVQNETSADTIPGPTKKDKPLNIAYVPMTMNTYYTQVLNGVKEEINKNGGDKFAKLNVLAPTNQAKQLEDQINILESLLTQDDLDVLCLSTENDAQAIPYLKKFAAKGVAVFMFNMPGQSEENKYYISNVGYDFYKASNLVGEWAVKHFGDQKVKMLFLEGLEGTHNTIRKQGFLDAIKGSNIEVAVSQSGGWTRDGGQNVTENALQSNSDISFIYGVYDEMTLGAMVAVKAANKLDKITVAGYDLTEDGYNSIKKGEMYASVYTNPKGMGVNLINTIKKYCILGESVDKNVFSDLKVYDRDNINEFDINNYKFVEK